MTKPANRLLTLILLLQNQPNQKAGNLAAQLGVSVRSLHRYMERLDEMGIPVYTERGPYGGFSLVRGYKLPPLVFTPEEAVAVSLGTGLVEEIWGKLYRDAARGVLAKLDNLLPDGQRQEVAWARRTMVSAGLQRTHLDILAPILEKLRQAAREYLQVEMAYQGPSQPVSTTRLLDTYALVHRWGWWYVVGFCHRRGEVRTFRLDRISSLTLLDHGFEPKSDFDIRAYLAQEKTAQPNMIVRLQFSLQMAPVARANTFTWEKLEELPDGSVIVSMLAPDLVWAASTALAFGPGVIVLEPEAVRQEVRAWAQAILEQYPESLY